MPAIHPLRRHRCERDVQPLLASAPTHAFQGGDEEALAKVSELSPTFELLDVPELVLRNEPVLLRDAWPQAKGWTWGRVRNALAGHELKGIIRMRSHDYRYAVPDHKAALDPLLWYEAARAQNLSAEVVIDELAAAAARSEEMEALSTTSWLSPAERVRRRSTWRDTGSRLLHFDGVPPQLGADLGHATELGVLYASEFDQRHAMQYAWLSSPGLRTHTHFDSDRNVFIQLIG